MKVKKFQVPRECFPRFTFASRNTPGIEARVKGIMKQAGMTCEKVQQCNIDTVIVYVYSKKEDSENIATKDIVKRNSDKIIELMNGYKTMGNCLEIDLISSELEEEDIQGKKSNVCFVIDDGQSLTSRKIKGDFSSRVTTKESLARDIDDYLELKAYAPFDSYCKILLNLLQDLDEIAKDEGTLPQLNAKDVQREAIEQLLEEIMALYQSSHIPVKDRPKLGRVPGPISNKEREKLFEICPTIKAVGYRFGKIQVYLEEINDKERSKEREQKIDEFMKNHNVSNYSSSNVFPRMKELMSAGSKVIARDKNKQIEKSGSLGCLAEMIGDATNAECALVSRHVVSDCNDVFLVENGEEIKIADIIESTTKHESGSLDIAAAKIIVPIDPEVRKLKDSTGNLRYGKLEFYGDGVKNQNSGRKVHIWGSKSKPGSGIITDANYVVKGLNVGLIQIQNEDSDEMKPFAMKGDSGAIVCSDDPDDENVIAHAMLIGVNSENTYIALPLDKGIEQLDRMTGYKITLFVGEGSAN